jgi:hypothetical protein
VSLMNGRRHQVLTEFVSDELSKTTATYYSSPEAIRKLLTCYLAAQNIVYSSRLYY